MPKEYVQQSLERDAYLSRKDDKQISREHLKRSVERLSKLMSLCEEDKAELLVYADQLLEHQTSGGLQRRDNWEKQSLELEKQSLEKESQVRRRVLQARAGRQHQNSQTQLPPAQADGSGASE